MSIPVCRNLRSAVPVVLQVADKTGDRDTWKLAEEFAERLKTKLRDDPTACLAAQRIFESMSTNVQHLVLYKLCGRDALDAVLKWCSCMQKVCMTVSVCVRAHVFTSVLVDSSGGADVHGAQND